MVKDKKTGKGRCRCGRVFNVYSKRDVIHCGCGYIITTVNGTWAIFRGVKNA